MTWRDWSGGRLKVRIGATVNGLEAFHNIFHGRDVLFIIS